MIVFGAMTSSWTFLVSSTFKYGQTDASNRNIIWTIVDGLQYI